jgi:hypothetical protein
MRAQKLREETIEKERDEHFNMIRPMFPANKEWRVKETRSVPVLTIYDDDMDLLDDEESSLIKNRSPPSSSMNVNMVFTLMTEFKGIGEEITQLCLGPKEYVFEKPQESSQHLRPLYV